MICPADVLDVDTVARMQNEAWTAMVRHGPDPHSFAQALGVHGVDGEAPRSSVRATQAQRFAEDPLQLHREDFEAWMEDVETLRSLLGYEDESPAAPSESETAAEDTKVARPAETGI